jgi:hypothetical protein
MVNENVLVIIIILSLAIFWSCICRLKQTGKSVQLRVRNRYVIIGVGSLFSAFGFWVFPFYGGEIYGLGIFVGSVAVGFWLDKKDWDHGPPASAFKGEQDETRNRVPDE